MANVIVYDPNSVPVPNRVTRYLTSVNASIWRDKPNVILNPVLPVGVAVGLLKVVGNEVLELDQTDLDAIAAKQAADYAAAEAARIAAGKEFAKGVLDGDEGYQVFLNALVKVIVSEFNTLRTLHSLPPRTRDQVKSSVITQIES